MLLYTLLHLSGYQISIDDLKNFRQLGSITPGHPEVGKTPGVDASAGPLGQGIPTAVGMAVAETMLNAMYLDADKIFNHYTYALCGDGCLHEGVSYEAISFAGRQKLNKLILLCDINDVTLDGVNSMAFDEDLKLRFKSCHWNILEVEDGNNIEDMIKQLRKQKEVKINQLLY